MEDQSNNSSGSSRRWTCEACGCNTNADTDRTCTICGTSNGPSLLRRAGYAARSGLFARSFAARRGIMNDEIGIEGDAEIWERVVDDVDMGGDDDEHAIAALAMEVAGVSGGAGGRDFNRQRFMEAARSFAMATRETQRPNPEELLQAANENGRSYQPKWINPSQVGGRMRSSNGIEVGEGDNQNVAHLPAGAGEGRALRAVDAFPRSAPFASFHLSSPSNSNPERRPRRAFGFRVAFQHPTKTAGESMGGCYLVGVTTTSFSAFGERNGLQQSPFFWGIEDGGNKYEGSRSAHGSRGSRRGQSNFAIELGPNDAPRNADSVLFGSREIVTCVVDFESRTLTFWRDETLLGTLVSNLPRGGNLYPVVVPYNAGVTVAITAMGGNPLPLLGSFAKGWKQAQLEKDVQRRSSLVSQRSLLIRDSGLTPELDGILRDIFSWYASDCHGEPGSAGELSRVEASRLWYRCGLKLSALDATLAKKSPASSTLNIDDFLQLVKKVIVEDSEITKKPDNSANDTTCEVGDRVELVEGYERYGDASNGPLQPGERGTVVELQEGRNGESHSVRVVYNGRRWWYQPQALLPEKSGLTESPGVWFLRTILRAHGYDHTTLCPLRGVAVSTSSWQVGDIVVPKKMADEDGETDEAGKINNVMESCIGRIVAETSSSASSLTSRGRESGTVLVEYVDKAFGEAVGIQEGPGSGGTGAAMETKRVRVSRLLHTSAFHGANPTRQVPLSSTAPMATELGRRKSDDSNAMDIDTATSENSVDLDFTVDDKIASDIKKMKRLDLSAIERVTKECKKNAAVLAGVFAAGLPVSMMAAVDCSVKRLQRSEDSESLSQAIAAIGRLAVVIAEQIAVDDDGKNSIAQRQKVEPPRNIENSSHRDFSRQLEADDEGNESASRNVRDDRRDPRSLRLSDSALMNEMGRTGRLSSLQQRRSMLLALMSRSRRSNSATLSDFLNREPNGPNRDMSLGNIMPPLGPFRPDAAGALHFGAPGDFSAELGWDDGALGDEGRGNRSRTSGRAALSSSSRSAVETSFLESVLRGRSDKVSSSSGKSAGAVQSSALRALISNGLLSSSLTWIKAALNTQAKRMPSKSPGRALPSLQTACDEEGTPLLLLAISLGCSVEILRYLVKLGATVGEKEIKEAARSNQPDSLSELLRGAVYTDGLVDLKKCSPEVASVIRDAFERQKERERKMRLEVGTFMVAFLRKLLDLALMARREQTSSDLCSRAVSCILVGDVLLKALHKRQEQVGSRSQNSRGAQGSVKSDDLTGPTDGSYALLITTPKGLLSLLPKTVISKSLFLNTIHVATFLLVVEDYLCSKDINDGAIGLTLLSSLLKKFPFFSLSSEIERYGFNELVSSHDAFASNKLAEISTRVAARTSPAVTKEASEAEALAATGVVLCPKRHAAVLHVTRHSSFRCDLCGKGVERGRVMHGCRECDWDACEKCTDVAEGGIVKWNHISGLAAECQGLLSPGGTMQDEDKDELSENILEAFVTHDNSSEINNLSVRLLQRDSGAIKELSALLKAQGGLTFHQFLTVILPALHASLLGRSAENCRVNLSQAGFNRRSKKPRVIGSSSREIDESFHSQPGDDRLSFCKDVILYLIKDGIDTSVSQEKPWALDTAENAEVAQRDSSDDDDDASDDGIQVERHSATSDHKGNRRAPELLRRLHQVLSLYENVALLQHALQRTKSSGGKAGDLQSLTKPLEIRLSPLVSRKRSNSSQLRRASMNIYAEPLMAVADLQLHILRTGRTTHPTYIAFCRRLAGEKAIIVERPPPETLAVDKTKKGGWRAARVVGFDEDTGFHSVQYAVDVKGDRDNSSVTLELKRNNKGDVDKLTFEENVSRLMLAAREYLVIRREKALCETDSKSPFDMEHLLADGIVAESEDETPAVAPNASIGARVESNCDSDNWQPHTIVAVDGSENSAGKDDVRYVLVSDTGEVHCGVESRNIRGLDSSESSAEDNRTDGGTSGRAGGGRSQISRAFPFLTGRRQSSDLSRSSSASSPRTPSGVGALKRTWSALSPIESMCPVEVNLSDEATPRSAEDSAPAGKIAFRCSLGDIMVDILAERDVVERPPRLRVKFSSEETLSAFEITAPEETTLVSLLWRLCRRDDQQLVGDRPHNVFYSVSCETPRSLGHEEPFSLPPSFGARASIEMPRASGAPTGIACPNELDLRTSGISAADIDASASWTSPGSRSRKLRQITTYLSDEEGQYRGLCDGLDEICVQCMEIIGLLSEGAEVAAEPKDKSTLPAAVFETDGLSKKLLEQLEDPLMVVGGALPEWCVVAPSFAPRVFSYNSRRKLLERSAFGVSRSTLKQQESKVNVGRLRQRMASLRARAVELVGEAFSGGAEDPTALQLQADELYGMEEALASRVKAAFRAEHWEEQALQVAKAAVHRDLLLSDAAAVMHKYSNDDQICRRRLEVRFDGESGFDAASGDEAGVTRGFYADVAEALLSCETIAGVSPAPVCPNVSAVALDAVAHVPAHGLPCRLPLWIPDMDASGHVIIPTPRADPRSAIGVYPRPLSSRHPQVDEVLVQFRFMGRLFAAAMRDGFMFPLPLSSAFLKLVQHGSDLASISTSWSGRLSFPNRSRGSSALTSNNDIVDDTVGPGRMTDRDVLLTSHDLPRPGFLGGEVFAVEEHICRALDRLDELDPQLSRSELESRYREVAAYKNFARAALGKTYDCSFDDYFQDRTFVDPLDPTQGLEAAPLCPDGHRKAVTIYNIREWVGLAKDFILYDGVIAQAVAFRRGVEDFFLADYLRLFTPEELQRDVCGVGDNVDNWTEADVRKLFKLDGGKGAAEALVAVAAIGGEGGAALSRRFGPSSPTINFVVKALLEATPKLRRQFLSFVTSVPIVTPGQIEVVPVVSPSGDFLPMRDPGCLPRANTCARRLYLPKFETYESFCQVLWAVVGEESKFKGFYEWRGS